MVVLIVGWFAQLLGMPGNWLIVAAAALDAWFVSPEARTAIGWNTVFVLVLLAVFGEVVELAAGAMGVSPASEGAAAERCWRSSARSSAAWWASWWACRSR